MTLLFMFIWFVMIWLAGLKMSHFLGLILIGVLVGVAVFPFLDDYQKDRVTTFLNPEEANQDDVFNVDQAEISIGSGGLWGKGYLQGTQSQLGFLRAQHTDFIFSVITEEMGLVLGSALVLGLSLIHISTAHWRRWSSSGWRSTYCGGRCRRWPARWRWGLCRSFGARPLSPRSTPCTRSWWPWPCG